MTARPLDAARDAVIVVQAQLIATMAERNGALEGRIGELEERLARLERAVSRNSGNSSMPPSADDLPGKTAPSPLKSRKGGTRRQGKQHGAPGAHLAWSQDPDTTVPLFPQGACVYGRDLAGAADLGVALRIRSSIPRWSPRPSSSMRSTRSPACAGGCMPRCLRPGEARPGR